MKFCKNLQRLALISDPEWAPYYCNYKKLKKLLNHLPPKALSARSSSPHSLSSSSTNSSQSAVYEYVGNTTSEAKTNYEAKQNAALRGPPDSKYQDTIGMHPGEIAFFKLLHSELKKASHFFDRAQQEFLIREERVRDGLEIVRQPNFIMVNEKWSHLAKSIYRLYKDLLLLETFAIMAYCSFSKILKKHDMVTGMETRIAFMENVVNKAKFTNYPQVLGMISRCEALYAEVSENLQRGGKEGLYEDERLFIHMVRRLNDQVSDTAEGEGAERNETSRRPVVPIKTCPTLEEESDVTLSLLSLVEENQKSNSREHQTSDDNGADCKDDRETRQLPGKRKTVRMTQLDKRQRHAL
jgi:SPX domain protein involved in polyphosphate accumulation